MAREREREIGEERERERERGRQERETYDFMVSAGVKLPPSCSLQSKNSRHACLPSERVPARANNLSRHNAGSCRDEGRMESE